MDALIFAQRRTNALFEAQLSAQLAEFAIAIISSHFQFLTNYAQNDEEKPKPEETISKLKREKIKNQAKNSKKSWLIDHYSNLQYFPHFFGNPFFADAVKQTRSISIHPHAIFLSRRIQAGNRYSIYLSRHI